MTNTPPTYPFNLRGWMLYLLAKMMAPDLSTRENIEKTIAKDRAEGPKTPPKHILKSIDFHESSECGMRVFHACRKSSHASPLKLLYLHGGAYVLDFQAIQWNLVKGLLDRVDADIIAPIYPLGPEANGIETIDAINTFYISLAKEYGTENIIVMGDSAGGGLALTLAHTMRDQNGPAPAALLLFSPCLDLTACGKDQPALERRDPALSINMVRIVGKMWAGDLDPADPRLSPLFAEQSNLPPTMVFSGDREILDSDALRLKSRNPDIEHRHYPEMMHVFPVSPLREGKQALNEAAAFIKSHGPKRA